MRFDRGGKITLGTFPTTNMATLTPATRMSSTVEDGAIQTPTEHELHELMTESVNSASHGFDTKSALEIARIINHEDGKIAGAVKKGPAGDRSGDRRRGPRSARWRAVDLCRRGIERPHRRARCLRVPACLLHLAAVGAVHRGRRPQGCRLCRRGKRRLARTRVSAISPAAAPRAKMS